MAATMAALPPAYRHRAKATNGLVVGTGLLCIATLMTFAAIAGAYFTIRTGHHFFPADYKKNNYMPSCMVASALMLMPLAEWIAWAVGQGERRQVAIASAMSAVVLFTMINGALYEIRLDKFTVGGSTYAPFFYAFMVGALLVFIGALAAVAVHAARFAGRQVSAIEPELARATALVLHTAAASWLLVWCVLFAATR